MSKTNEVKQGKKRGPQVVAGPKNEVVNRVGSTAGRDTSPSTAAGMALVARLQFTEQECEAAVSARDVPEAVRNGLARVSIPDISEAYSPEEVDALTAADSGLRLKQAQVDALPGCASRVALAASVIAKLTALAQVVEHAARKDADLLDAISHVVVPQLTAQSAVDDTVAARHEPLLAYWKRRFPGGPKGPRTPKTSPVTPSVKA
ncbi:MAG: hypothetical protein JST54_34200 [Deltaproteobacteria bacterium]|nr:hypothetical protein [Deltaproteobacteria bacterium]